MHGTYRHYWKISSRTKRKSVFLSWKIGKKVKQFNMRRKMFFCISFGGGVSIGFDAQLWWVDSLSFQYHFGSKLKMLRLSLQTCSFIENKSVSTGIEWPDRDHSVLLCKERKKITGLLIKLFYLLDWKILANSCLFKERHSKIHNW